MQTRQWQLQKRSSSATPPQPESMFPSRPRRDPAQDASVQLQADESPEWQARRERYIRNSPDFSKMPMEAPERSPIQAKLTVGAPNDQYEQEADRVADHVMSMPDSAVQQPIQREAMSEGEELQPKPLADSIAPIQREAMPEEDEVHPKLSEVIAQREAIPDEEDNPLQRKAIASSDIQREEMSEDDEMRMKPVSNSTLQRAPDGNLQAGEGIESRLSQSKGGGSPLSDEVRSFMEPRFGADFSQVRVHTGSESVQMNRDLNAQAFTHKQDVYFGAGNAPEKDTLTAHELTHVVQQTRVGQIQAAKELKNTDLKQKVTDNPYSGDCVQREATEVGETTSYDKNISFTIAADRSNGCLLGLWDVGHSWIKFQVPEQAEDSYGFWPKGIWQKFPKILPKKLLAIGITGEVHHPDTAHTPTDEKTVMVNNAQLQKGIVYAKAHTHSNYSLLNYNCTSFARGMFEVVTGSTAPFAGVLIQDPKDFAKSLNREKYPSNTEGGGHEGGSQSYPEENRR